MWTCATRLQWAQPIQVPYLWLIVIESISSDSIWLFFCKLQVQCQIYNIWAQGPTVACCKHCLQHQWKPTPPSTSTYYTTFYQHLLLYKELKNHESCISLFDSYFQFFSQNCQLADCVITSYPVAYLSPTKLSPPHQIIPDVPHHRLTVTLRCIVITNLLTVYLPRHYNSIDVTNPYILILWLHCNFCLLYNTAFIQC